MFPLPLLPLVAGWLAGPLGSRVQSSLLKYPFAALFSVYFWQALLNASAWIPVSDGRLKAFPCAARLQVHRAAGSKQECTALPENKCIELSLPAVCPG